MDSLTYLIGETESSMNLNFDSKEFFDADFNIDEFIHSKRQVIPLDALRDDLGVHLKQLRSSVIELINLEYSQFVNLSSHLVGLDNKIRSIVTPLQKSKQDLKAYLDFIEENITALEQSIVLKRDNEGKKSQLRNLSTAFDGLDYVSKLLDVGPDCAFDVEHERLKIICDELEQLRCYLYNTSCSQPEELLKKFESIRHVVRQILKPLLMKYGFLKTSETKEEIASRIVDMIRMFLQLDLCAELEEEVSCKVIAVICESSIAKKEHFTSVLASVEEFLEESVLIKSSTVNTELASVSKLNLISRSVFPVVVSILTKQFPQIWSPSSPDSFHSNWLRVSAFLDKLESYCPSSKHLIEFQNSQEMKEFIGKWQFPVYFQLRFHSLAIELECSLEDITYPCSTSDFKLDSTRVLFKVLNQCWDDECFYLSRLHGRFLKAAALFVSRYIQETTNFMSTQENVDAALFLNIYCDCKVSELGSNQLFLEQLQMKNKETGVLASDIEEFIDAFGWKALSETVQNKLFDMTLQSACSHLSSVTEIPRLYRRTNRNQPKKHSDYVDSILSPLKDLKSAIEKVHLVSLWEVMSAKLAEAILQRYSDKTQEVLLAVLKMEESIKRLKKAKGQSVNYSSEKMTDDDKIRLQIKLDTEYLKSKITELCPDVDVSIL